MSSVSSVIPLVSSTVVPFPDKYTTLRGDVSNLPLPISQVLEGPEAAKYRVQFIAPDIKKGRYWERFLITGATDEFIFAEVLLSRTRSNFFINLGVVDQEVRREINGLYLKVEFD